VCFISVGEADIEATFPEYLDILYSPPHAEGVFDAFAAALGSPAQLKWDTLRLGVVSNDATILRIASKGFRRLTTYVHCSPLPGYLAAVNKSFDGYLDTVGRSKKTFRRVLKRFDRDPTALTFERAQTPAQAHEYLDQLIDLHQSRWRQRGEAGAFATDTFRSFHHALVDRLFTQKHIVLTRLLFNGEPQCVLYGFLFNRKLDAYQSGMVESPPIEVKSPGILTHLLTIKCLAQDEELVTYDFLGGASAYKATLATSSVELSQVAVHRITLRFLAKAAPVVGLRLVRRLLRPFLARHR
jgi:CelD/BcsL family acetyltransferase involved in cellulose biosynthesis